jgi:hypothetical protein
MVVLLLLFAVVSSLLFGRCVIPYHSKGAPKSDVPAKKEAKAAKKASEEGTAAAPSQYQDEDGASEEAVSEDQPVAVDQIATETDYSRQCTDDVTIKDCREVTATELKACGFCVDAACSNSKSSVRLMCESGALLQHAFEVAKSGKGVVNVCGCQTQKASAVLPVNE